MSGMKAAVLAVLGPLVGAPAATMCVSSAAMALGKSADTLTRADWPAVADRIHSDMRPFASPELLDSAIAEIENRLM